MSTEVDWIFEHKNNLMDSNRNVFEAFLTYADRLVRRGLISNTLGNIAVRLDDPLLPGGSGILTKPRGISLEEVSATDLIVTDVRDTIIYSGDTPPSGGHLLNQKILYTNRDVNAVIHSHPDIIIGVFSQIAPGEFDFVSVDTAIVLGGPPRILEYGVNPEGDIDVVRDPDLRASCLIMPNHGLTTSGRTLSEAYHRHTSMIAETSRYLSALVTARSLGRSPNLVPSDVTNELYGLGSRFLYGATSTKCGA